MRHPSSRALVIALALVHVACESRPVVKTRAESFVIRRCQSSGPDLRLTIEVGSATGALCRSSSDSHRCAAGESLLLARWEEASAGNVSTCYLLSATEFVIDVPLQVALDCWRDWHSDPDTPSHADYSNRQGAAEATARRDLGPAKPAVIEARIFDRHLFVLAAMPTGPSTWSVAIPARRPSCRLSRIERLIPDAGGAVAPH